MINIKKTINNLLNIFKQNSLNNNETPTDKDLIPYFKEYSPTPTTEYGMELYLKRLNTPLGPTEYKQVFDQYINKVNFLDNKDNLSILNNIYEDVKIIYDKVKILEKLGINITLDLTGGAVRDFVMGKGSEISDLDLMFSFNDINEGDDSKSSILSVITTKNLKDLGFSSTELNHIGWSDTENNLNMRKTKLIELCLVDKVEKVFTHTERSRQTTQEFTDSNSEPYMKVFRDRLCGVIKIKKQNHYKIDILITDLKKYQFLQEFDINLCKASFVFKNNFYNKNFPQKPEHLLSRFVAEVDFFADIYNKKITVDVSDKSLAMLDSILNKHLPKVIAKYSDYEFNLTSSDYLNPQYLVDVQNKIFSDKLTKNLNKADTYERKKIKI